MDSGAYHNTGTVRRIRKKRLKKIGRRVSDTMRLVIVFALLALVIIGGWYIAFHTSFFRIRSIRVEGCNHLDAEKILLLSGLNRAMSVFAVEPDVVENRIRALARVKDVRLDEESPGRLVIRLEERVARALVIREGRYFEVDNDGVIIKTYTENPPLELPIVSGIRIDYAEPGFEIEDPAMVTALHWLDVLPESLKNDMSELCMEGDNTALFTLGGVKVYLGNAPHNFEDKKDVIVSRLKELEMSGIGVEYLDARFSVPVEKLMLRGDSTGNQR